MLPRWLHPPSGSGSLVSRPTLTSLYPGRRRRPINVVRRLPSSTLTNALPPASSPSFAFPHLSDSHFVRSTDIDSRPDAELQKHLGINRNLDHDDSPQHHKHNPNLDRYDPNQSHSTGEKSHKQHSSDLGSFTPPPQKDKGKKKSSEITDREWEIRTGRAIYIIQQTLPDFFSLGLVSSSIDNGKGKRKATPASSTTSGQGGVPEGATAEHPELEPEPEPEPEPESIYSPKIRLVYTPPARLPSPFPATLHVEGALLFLSFSVQ
ncbi:hypothetical protein PILCRDRAFT_735030 [Piloderma croceum F 1598]|uniref:Uncharacterized protein n=1 Tax=Piloderma croceum (strain F 1598) TaxID=765440 RepID=A0A0C3EZ34_PILCF|nr:hypothetical protein PILCRDRAFT_735030 [Piloderma croceum F 1598]